ncbi:RNA ligase family protein [Pontivivens insulae]|nr:RNA ligase family protein [Pontivivens insulae]
MQSVDRLMVEDIVVTEKMDGENTTIHAAGCHARSPDSRYHPSRDWLKAFAAGVSPMLFEDERIIGENLYAKHSVAYDALPSFFLGFSWIVGNVIQSWDDTLERFGELGVTPVSTLYRGAYRDGLFEDIAHAMNSDTQEGFVVRTAIAFPESDMPLSMGKYVREGHVQSETHWMQAPLVPNRLA